jgi:hypothetical protein
MSALIIKKRHIEIIHLCPTKYRKWLNKKKKPRYISCSIRPTRKNGQMNMTYTLCCTYIDGTRIKPNFEK